MATKISVLVSGSPASAANLTGVAALDTTDKNTASVGVTYAQLRTALLAGGTGYATTDPLVLGGTLTFPATAQAISGSGNGLAIRNSGNTRDNLLVGDAGANLNLNSSTQQASIVILGVTGETSGAYFSANGSAGTTTDV